MLVGKRDEGRGREGSSEGAPERDAGREPENDWEGRDCIDAHIVRTSSMEGAAKMPAPLSVTFCWMQSG